MSARPPRDEWMIPTLEALLPANVLAQLRDVAKDSLWEEAVRRGFVSDEEILEALATRFRMKVADIRLVSQQARELVPEQLARKYRVLPPNISDSAPDFATGRTVRMTLGSPAQIAARLDEIYRPEGVVEKILEGVTGNYEVQRIEDEQDSNLDVDAAKAGERPIVKVGDHRLAQALAARSTGIT